MVFGSWKSRKMQYKSTARQIRQTLMSLDDPNHGFLKMFYMPEER